MLSLGLGIPDTGAVLSAATHSPAPISSLPERAPEASTSFTCGKTSGSVAQIVLAIYRGARKTHNELRFFVINVTYPAPVDIFSL
jgi:hypothetical protein